MEISENQYVRKNRKTINVPPSYVISPIEFTCENGKGTVMLLDRTEPDGCFHISVYSC